MENSMASNGKAPAPYYDKERRAIVHEDVHLTDANRKRLVEREYHSYDVPALKADLQKIDTNIEIFRNHIREEQARKEEIRQLIEEGEERDRRLRELMG